MQLWAKNTLDNKNRCKMKVIALIPARAGSKRVPFKNIKEFGGKPLILWSIEVAQALKLPCYVSTESRVIGDISRQAGAEVIHRPLELASDTATDFDVINHALSHVSCDLLVYLRPTTPLRDARRVWAAVRILALCDALFGSLRSVEEMPESAYKCFELVDGLLSPVYRWVDYEAWNLTDEPNQAVPKTYHPNGYVDIVRREIVERGVLWGERRYGFVTPPALELDTPEQWEYGEYLVERRKH
jgi:CMP-N,N'-diacetyllegionaminic acid synthase